VAAKRGKTNLESKKSKTTSKEVTYGMKTIGQKKPMWAIYGRAVWILGSLNITGLERLYQLKMEKSKNRF